ncbi:SGNH hydrolase-type esterase domain-containing protein [Mucor mucedo]|uniref:SGNH hydrolase-type esterase domain-containing protein n=1 Tax=Mucor mucedo TaxID=29922 RepID=UPI002220BFE9|nr:SGNH hydrolase-type esterase domain-containing protein [Mucor mucedo]KAI7871362.1 SGNH hydrolase-type esterase domain-containing protein [Mucor mucedo]
MPTRSSLYLIILTSLTALTAAKNVTHITECPSLTPRCKPTNVNDLRADDIKVIGALGDSITTGFGIMGFDLSIPQLAAMENAKNEYRGLSYGIGGDKNAFTIPNYIEHYQPNITGFSKGAHPVQTCNPDNCNRTLSLLGNGGDGLNAALTGATSMHLGYELDYLIESMQNIQGIDFENDWKMINIQIGSNDMCGACNTSYVNEVTPEKYGGYIEAAIDRIHASVPNVIVNLISTFNVSQVFPLTEAYPNHCVNRNIDLCPCASVPGGLEIMSQLNNAYNEKLVQIYKKYQKSKFHNFTVVYQPIKFNIPAFPIDFFSTLDCFHPSLKGHEWVSKVIWNQLFLPQSYKPKSIDFDGNQTIYCPVDSDRINAH